MVYLLTNKAHKRYTARRALDCHRGQVQILLYPRTRKRHNSEGSRCYCCTVQVAPSCHRSILVGRLVQSSTGDSNRDTKQTRNRKEVAMHGGLKLPNARWFTQYGGYAAENNLNLEAQHDLGAGCHRLSHAVIITTWITQRPRGRCLFALNVNHTYLCKHAGLRRKRTVVQPSAPVPSHAELHAECNILSLGRGRVESRQR